MNQSAYFEQQDELFIRFTLIGYFKICILLMCEGQVPTMTSLKGLFKLHFLQRMYKLTGVTHTVKNKNE